MSKSRNSYKICNYYKKKGHIKKECFKLQNKEKKFGNKQGEKYGNLVRPVLWNQIIPMENFWLPQMLIRELVRFWLYISHDS